MCIVKFFFESDIAELIKNADRPISVLNLFAYTGGATVAAAKAGASVCHVDASKGMVAWAKDNAKASGLADKPIRYIVDDVLKFVLREQRRGNKYHAIIMDPPSYGRGPNGEIWKLENELYNNGKDWELVKSLIDIDSVIKYYFINELCMNADTCFASTYFYIDGKETWRTSEPGICNQPGYLKLTTEFGSWAKPIVPEELPDCVRVDWVRVYEEA